MERNQERERLINGDSILDENGKEVITDIIRVQIQVTGYPQPQQITELGKKDGRMVCRIQN